MHHARDATVGAIDDDDRGDLSTFHDIQRFGRKRRGWDGYWPRRHDVARRHFEDLCGAVHMAPEIAVGDDPDEFVAVVDDAGHSEAFARHFVDHIAHARRA